MEFSTVLWSLPSGAAIALAAVCGSLWIADRRDLASLALLVLGLAVAASGYFEICMMHSATPAEFGEWLRLYHIPVFFALIAQLLFVHYYLGGSRLWLLWTIIAARMIIVVVNFSVEPNYNFAKLLGLRHLSLFGERISVIGQAVPRAGWPAFAIASLILLIAYLVDSGLAQWRSGRKDSRRKALTVVLGISVPLLCTLVYTQLLVFGVVHGPLSNVPWFLGTLLVMAYELGGDFVASRRALLELAELQNQLIRAERANALGHLASAMAHELAQPLTANATNATAALMHMESETPDLEELRAIVADISRDSRRGIEMVIGMRELFKGRAIDLQPLRLEDVVKDVVLIVDGEVSAKHITLALRMQPDLPDISGDRVHLTQVLVNLLTNSIHAVQIRPPHERHVVLEARADNMKGKVELTVRDSGCGVPPGLADKLFRPFFTSKPDGMGVGLTLSRKIIEAHGGQLWNDQASGQDGAVFRLTLQRA